MPQIIDYDPNDEEQGSSSGSPRGGTAGGGSRLAQPSQQQESTYTPWSRFMSANQDVSNREAGKLTTQVQGDVDTATSSRDAASNAQSDEIHSNYQGYQSPDAQQARGPAVTNGTIQQPGAASNFAAQPAFGSSTGGQQQEDQPTPPSPVNGRTGTARPSKLTDLGYRAGLINPDKVSVDMSTGAPNTTGKNIAGHKDLEDQLGSTAWQSLIGNTMKAQNEASALGSDTGVQSILQRQQAQPVNSAFDAALISGAGGPAFANLNRQYGGNQLSDALVNANAAAQGRWDKLMGDVDSASTAKNAAVQGSLDDMRTQAADAASRSAQEAAQQQQLQQQIDYLKAHFPIPNGWDDAQSGQSAFIAWINKAKTSTDDSTLHAWSDQIYGPSNDPQVYRLHEEQLQRDIAKMTPQEYQAFIYGVVPSWMGLGSKASGGAGGNFWGLGNTGNRVTGQTTNDPTAENAEDWNNKQKALQTYYSILEAIMAGSAGA